jgi:hypothetical protein
MRFDERTEFLNRQIRSHKKNRNFMPWYLCDYEFIQATMKQAKLNIFLPFIFLSFQDFLNYLV